MKSAAARLSKGIIMAMMIHAGAAAAADSAKIEVSVQGVIPTIGLSIDLAGDSSLISTTRTAHSIDLGYAYGHGTDKQSFYRGDKQVVFGGEIFTTPQDLNYEMSIRFAHLGYRYRRYFGQRELFGIEGLIGVGWASLGLTATGRTQTASEYLSDGGAMLGFGALWRFRESTAMHLRLTGLSTGADTGVTSANRFEFGVSQALGRHFSLSAGVTRLSVYSAREDRVQSTPRNKSPINATATGLGLGLNVIF